MFDWRPAIRVRHAGLVVLGACLVLVPPFAAAEYETDARILVDDGTRLVLQIDLGDYVLEPVDVADMPYMRVFLPGEPSTILTGSPALPHVPRSVIIPDRTAVTARIVPEDSSFLELADVDVLPSKGPIPRTIDPATVPYTFGPAYEQDAFYPADAVKLGTPYILRDFRGVVVDACPFQYNPVRRLLRVYTTMVIELTFTGDDGVNPLLRDAATSRALSRAFHDLYGGHFLNYAGLAPRYTPLEEEGDLLIICHDPWVADVQPLADHKSAHGIDTAIVPVGDIGNNASAIAAFIQDVYDTSDLAFVLLVGDADQVAPPFLSGGSADPDYAKVQGTDEYPDIFVGRFSAENTAHVATQVQRVIDFETQHATQQDWYHRATGIASSLGEGQGDDGESDSQHMELIRADFLAAGYDIVDPIYDPGATKAAVFAALNAGRGIVNYCGHGSVYAWSTSGFNTVDVDNLTNVGMLPFLIGVACQNGMFADYTCFAEAWLRATHGGEPAGAIGAYMSSVNQSWAIPMCAQDEIVDRFLDASYVSLGALCYAGSCQMMDEYGYLGLMTFNTWILFGDPSLRIVGVLDDPTGLGFTPGSDFRATGDVGGPFSPDTRTYTLRNYNSTPLEYAVIVDAPWLSVSPASGTLAPLATQELTVSLNHFAAHLGPGYHAALLTVTNLTDHDGDTTRRVDLTLGAPTLQYEWNLDTDPGWSCAGQWEWGPPLGAGGEQGAPDPTAGYTESCVYGYNLQGDYAGDMLKTHLVSESIDCQDLMDVRLSFWRWLGVEQPLYDHAALQVSKDGVKWVLVWENESVVNDGAWTYQEYDLASVADDQPTVYLRWTMGPTDGTWQYCGWNIDDVRIWARGPGATLHPPGDLNCDGVLTLADIHPFTLALSDPPAYADAFPDCDPLLADLNLDALVDVRDINPFVNALAAAYQ